MKIETNTRKIEPIERVAMALNLKGDEENIALKIQDKINLKDKLIRKLKFVYQYHRFYFENNHISHLQLKEVSKYISGS